MHPAIHQSRDSRARPARLSVILLCALVVFAAPFSHGQGALTPPGAPAPTMKTLDQVEARTLVNAANTPGDATNSFIISKSGSYYLTGNITGVVGKNGISIQATDVTLDLNGFAVIGAGTGAVKGVEVAANSANCCVRNGAARGWGTGVAALGVGALLQQMRLMDNEVVGLKAGNGAMVRDCVATGNGFGFHGSDRTQFVICIATENASAGFAGTSFVTLLDCTASRNGDSGFSFEGGCSFIRCTASRNRLAGISAGDNCTVLNCTTTNNQYGIFALRGCSVVDCLSSGNTLVGIFVGNGSTVRGCPAQGNNSCGIAALDGGCHITGNTCNGNGQGINVDGTLNRVEGNSCNSNTDYGFSILGSRTLVVRNSAGDNGTNYSFSSATTAVAIDLRVGGSDANTPPWANFIH